MGDEVIVKTCLELIDDNGKETLMSESFVDLRQETVKTVISRDTLDVPTEVDVWNACVKWAEAECKRQGKLVSAWHPSASQLPLSRLSRCRVQQRTTTTITRLR